MSKNKKTPKQRRKTFRVGFGLGVIFKTRSAKSALRKYIRNNLVHDLTVIDYELDNLGSSLYGISPEELFSNQINWRTFVEGKKIKGRIQKLAKGIDPKKIPIVEIG